MHQTELDSPLHQIELRSSCAYPIGSRKRSLARLSALLTLWIAVLVVLYWILSRFTDWPLFLFLLIVILTVIHRALDRNAGGMWAVYIMKDSAYGWVTPLGIEYQTPFRKDVVHCSQIAQLDYSPRTGRITMYLHDRALPVQFGPHNVTTFSKSPEFSLSRFLRDKIESCGGIFVEQLSSR